MAMHTHVMARQADDRSLGRALQDVHAMQPGVRCLRMAKIPGPANRQARRQTSAGFRLMLDSVGRCRAAQPSAPCRVYVPNP